MHKHEVTCTRADTFFYPRSLQVVFIFWIPSNIFKTLFGSTPKTLFFSKNIMTSPRLPLVEAQWSFLSEIRLSIELHGLKVTAPPIKNGSLNLNGIFLTSKLKPWEFRTSVFFYRWHCYFHFGSMEFSTRIPDKNDRCAFTRGSRGEVMIFFEKNKVLGVEPNRILNILEGI